MASRLSLHAACGTDPGQLRNINQDNVYVLIRQQELGEPLGLLVVADGMGGHKAGEIASQLAVDAIKDNLSWMWNNPYDGLPHWNRLVGATSRGYRLDW